MKRVGYVVVLVALSGIIVTYFARPTHMELVSSPPTEFLRTRPEWSTKRREAESRFEFPNHGA